MPWDIIALPALLCFGYGFWKGLRAHLGKHAPGDQLPKELNKNGRTF